MFVGQGWEFAHRFFKLLLWAKKWLWKRAHCSLCFFVMSDLIELLQVALLKEQRERFAQGHSFVKSDKRESLPTLFKEERLGIKKGKTNEKFVKNIWKYNFIQANCLFFESDSLESRANHWHCSFLKKSRVICSLLLFCKEQGEQFAHSHSFLKSDESNSLTRAIHSREQITYSCSLNWAIFSKRAKSESLTVAL